MKTIRNYSGLLAFTVALLLIALIFSTKAELPLPVFLVPDPETSNLQEISLFDAGDGNYYVFLPSYADMETVSIAVGDESSFSLGDTALWDGMGCAAFAPETPYAFFRDGSQIATLWFFRSANVAAMYIDTASGSMTGIHKDKDYKETASVTLYTPEGIRSFSETRSTLKGRGNATWNYDKRAYTLTLSSDQALLDMPPATKWVLLANATDKTNLNNKLILDLASRVGLHWTPESRWVDLYLNGTYHGLYLLTEKVEVQDNRLVMDAASGDFLCRVDLSSRWETLQNPFFSDSGRTIELSYPLYPTDDQQTEIEYRVSQMEQAIFSGADLRHSAIFDLDSWVRRYLIDEISANIDADLASSYFYCSDGVFYAGPAWDYDMVLGNSIRNQEPCSFIARNAKKGEFYYSTYYRALCRNESFCSRVRELYRTEFVPELQKLLNGEIDQLIAFISKASRSNALRWHSMYEGFPSDFVLSPDALKDYLSRRIRFLDSAWLENTDYCTLQFEPSAGSAYWNVSVETGSCLENAYLDIESDIWFDIKTGEAVDLSQPVTRDMILSRQPPEETAPEIQGAEDADSGKNLSLSILVVVLATALLLVLLVIFAVIDLVQRRKERKNTPGHKETVGTL